VAIAQKVALAVLFCAEKQMDVVELFFGGGKHVNRRNLRMASLLSVVLFSSESERCVRMRLIKRLLQMQCVLMTRP
jgi:hypothetical protein